MLIKEPTDGVSSACSGPSTDGTITSRLGLSEVLVGARGERQSAKINGDLLRLNMTRPASVGLPSCVVIGCTPRRQTM